MGDDEDMAEEAAESPAAAEAPDSSELLGDEPDLEPRTPMKRLGSTRKLAAYNNIRAQLSEQTRVLEARAEATAGVLGELHDYCRRRGELELEYSRALDKLARGATQRHRDLSERRRRERWHLAAPYAGWRAALDVTRALAADHAALAALYAGPLAARLQRAADDALRLHRKCRDVVLERHEEVGAALAAAAAAGKAHAAAAADWRAAALKLRAALDARADPPRHKKIKALDKELDKRRARHGARRALALRARAEYALCLEAANATLRRYYLDDIADVVLGMEVGLEAVVGRWVRCAGAAEAARGAAAGEAAGALRAAAEALDAAADRARLLEEHGAAFAAPRPLAPAAEAEPAPEELLGEAEAEAPPSPAEEEARAELRQRLRRLEAAARALRAECRENAKTLDAAEAELVRQMEGEEAQWEVGGMFGAGAGGAGGAAPVLPPPPEEDQEDYYLAKFRAYVSCATRLARAESKAGALRSLLGGAGGAGGAPDEAEEVPRRAARGAGGSFGAPLELRLPRVLTECVRVIAAHGLRTPGVFRVCGSAHEVGALRAAFERGERPLEGALPAARDVHAVCALLKLFLRSLRPPLLPARLQARLLRAARLADEAQFCAALAAALAELPAPALLVLRYLFAFLAHVAAHARDNLMDAWNLAVCLGPTLLAAGGEGSQRLARQNRFNELVKRTIELHERVFPQDVAPHALYVRREPADELLEPVLTEEPDAACVEPGARWSEETQPGGALLDAGHVGGHAEGHVTLEEDTLERLLPDTTPDLVRHLPDTVADSVADSGADSVADSAADTDAADTFVHNSDTLRKRTVARSRSESPAQETQEGEPGGETREETQGEAQAQGVQRVRAQFAALTLTGGSLQPPPPAPAALPPPPPPPAASKLLRRPTPHPRPAPPRLQPH